MILYKYYCTSCEVDVYVNWFAGEDYYRFPCCPECGEDNKEDELITYIGEVKIKEAE